MQSIIENFSNFNVINDFNKTRTDFFDATWHSNKPNSEKLAGWFLHKGLSLICIPANLTAAAVTTAGCALSAATLGTLKIVVFAGSLGNVKLKFSTGCDWLANRSFDSLWNLARNAFELIVDGVKLTQKGVELIKWVGKQIYIDQIVQKIFDAIKEIWDFCTKRVSDGIELAIEDEATPVRFKTPPFLSPINDPIEKLRYSHTDKERSTSKIFKHILYSTVSFPLNGIAAIITGSTALIMAAILVTKIALGTFFKLQVPLPTYAGQASGITYGCIGHIATDIKNHVQDSVILIYKVSEVLGIHKVIATVQRVIRYIPEALFEK